MRERRCHGGHHRFQDSRSRPWQQGHDFFERKLPIPDMPGAGSCLRGPDDQEHHRPRLLPQCTRGSKTRLDCGGHSVGTWLDSRVVDLILREISREYVAELIAGAVGSGGRSEGTTQRNIHRLNTGGKSHTRCVQTISHWSSSSQTAITLQPPDRGSSLNRDRAAMGTGCFLIGTKHLLPDTSPSNKHTVLPRHHEHPVSTSPVSSDVSGLELRHPSLP
jgi:hypothetical protein